MEVDETGEPAGSPAEPEAPVPGTPAGTTPDPSAAPENPSSDATAAGRPGMSGGRGSGTHGTSGERPGPAGASGGQDEGGGEPAAQDAGTGGTGADVPKGRTGRNLPLAIGVGLTLGALVLISLYTVKEIFLGVMVVFLLLGMRELTEAFGSRDVRAPFIPLATGMVAAPVVAYVWGGTGLVAVVSLTVLAVMVTRMPEGADGYVRDVTAGVFVTGYLVMAGGIVALLMRPDDGDHRIVIFVAVTVASDVGGYFAGSFLGRHKMAPTISPKKTWEGVTGSAAMCMLVGAWLVWWLLDDGRIWPGVLIGLATVFTATVGDLIESVIKRDLGIKDMGTLLPGHGGVMDRLDSLVAAAPVVWLLLELFDPPG